MATKKTGTAVAPASKSSTSVVSIQDTLRKMAEQTAGQVAPPTGATIRITQDKKFLLPDGTKTEGPIELVIVDFLSANNFYEGAFDPKNISPPGCFAIGRIPTDLVPSDNSPNKQSDACSSCPMNQFGSDGSAKACKNERVLAVLPPDADATTPMWKLKVSPAALKGFDGYVSTVVRTLGVPPIGVITTVELDPSVTYAKLRFSDPRPNKNVADMLGRQAEAEALLSAEPDVSSYQSPKKAATGGRRR